MPNPDFTKGPREDEDNSTWVSATATSTRPVLETSADTQDQAPVANNDSDSTESALSTSSSASSSSSSGKNSSTGTEDPKQVAAKAYCNRRSIACYPMISVEGDRFEDYGTSSFHMPASDLGLVEAGQSRYPLPKAVDAEPDGKYKASKPYKIAPNGAIGFDIWLRPTSPSSRNWTAFAVDNYVSLLRLTDGDLRCAFEGSSLSKFLDRPFNPREGEFHHIACAFDGTSKYMWVDGRVEISTRALPSSWPESTPFIFGWNSFAERPFDGHIGAIRVWDDIQAMESEIERLFPQI